MKFFNLNINQLKSFAKVGKPAALGSIQGYDDLKSIVLRALESEGSQNILFIGPPASSKTMFLMGIQDIRKDAIYFDSANTTNRILDVLEEKRPKIILADEIDKMSRSWQERLLGFLESGRVDVERQKKQYHFEIKGAKVFATANDLSRISKPLQSRFMKLFLKRYTEEEFLNVAEKVLPKLSPSIARYIGAKVWGEQGDIRNVIQVGKLVKRDDGPEQIGTIIQTIMKYGQEAQEK